MNKEHSLKHNEPQFSAIILAAGYSSRMNGKLKSLLPLGLSSNMLTMAINSFKDANILDIHVVVGHEHLKIEHAVKDFGVNIIHNKDFASGMFSSICSGFKSIINNHILPHAAFVLPVDAPLIKSNTIELLAANWSEFSDAKRILIPIFMENCGHPPLIGSAHFDNIINYQGPGGLRGYLATLFNKDKVNDFLQGKTCSDSDSKYVKFMAAADEGIISDIDTMHEYEKAQDFLQITHNRKYASLAECYHILQQSDVSERIIKHSYMVALGALRLGFALADKFKIRFDYHVCGGLLHDICRLHKNHALMGQKLLYELGLKDLARIVGSHTTLPKSILEAMNISLYEESVDDNTFTQDIDQNRELGIECMYACICVYLSDKMFSGDKFVTVNERFAKVKDKFAHDQLALKAIEHRQTVALAVNDWFYKVSKVKAEHCVQKKCGHLLESQLEELFKVCNR